MNRQIHIAFWLRMLSEREIRLGRYAKKLFIHQAKKAQSAFLAKGESESLYSIEEGRNDWNKLLVAHSAETTKLFIQYTKAQLGAKKTAFQDLIEAFITKNALDKSIIITKTTKNLVKNTLMKVQQEGLSEEQIAKLIRKRVGGVIGDIRSRTISRTETHNAATYSMQKTAEETEQKLIREWVCVHDERTRDSHAEVDGQQREMDSPFEVDGELIDRPGDGSAANAINCRCTLIYIPKSIGEF